MQDMSAVLEALEEIKGLISKAMVKRFSPTQEATGEEMAEDGDGEMPGEGMTAIKVSVKPKELDDDEKEKLMRKYRGM